MNAKWKDYLVKNKTESKLKPKDDWKIKNLATIEKIGNTVPDEFAEKCQEKLNEKVTGFQDPRYIELIGWYAK